MNLRRWMTAATLVAAANLSGVAVAQTETAGETEASPPAGGLVPAGEAPAGAAANGDGGAGGAMNAVRSLGNWFGGDEGGGSDEAGSRGAAAPGSDPEDAEPSRPSIVDLGTRVLTEEARSENAQLQAKLSELRYLATERYRKGRFSEAVRYLNELVTLRPYEAEFHFALGLVYRREGRLQEALKKYQDVLDLGGPKPLVAVLKAEVFAKSNDREKVYEMFQEAAVSGRNIIADVHNLPLLESFEIESEFIRLALQLERFEVEPRSFDPFTNPFLKKDTKPPPGEQRSTGPKTPQEQASLLTLAKTAESKVQFYVKLQDEEKAMRAYNELKSALEQRSQITVPRIEAEFRELQARLPDIEIQIASIRLRYYYGQAQEKLKHMREAFDGGSYQEVEKAYADLQNLARNMTSANRKFKAVADQIMQRAEAWRSRARVRVEFEEQRPEIQGIIISGEDKMAILDDRIVKQGEGLDDFRVVRIESNRVTFRYKGEEIPMVFRRY